MSVKILGGIAKGFSLATPKSETIRPTSVLIKRKIFDWRQNLSGHIFIDLCAGSGAMGFEALSRGADKVFLNDFFRPSFLTTKQNQERIVEAFKFDPDCIVTSNLDAVAWLKKELSYQITDTQDCILFLDPPYENHALYEEVLKILKEIHFLGEVWVESDKLKGFSPGKVTGAFCSVIKSIEHGDHFVVIGKVV